MVQCVLIVVDLDGAGAQWCRQEQGAERSYAGSPGLQRAAPHTAIYGAHPQGMGLRCAISVIIVKKDNFCGIIHNQIHCVVIL